ncbi:MAG: hypothetical protein JXB85_07790 [Anaerolineales bacterium]|nr:hypothetical protein [Anaerolineales bacterium]
MTRPVFFAVGPEFLARDGLTEAVLPWEDGRRLATRRGTFEWWYFDAHLEDGSTAVIVFATKPITRPGDPLRPNLSLTITRPDGIKLARFAFFPAEAFSAAEHQCEVRIGSSWVKWHAEDSTWNYTLHAEADELSTDLTFRSLVPPWRPGAGKCFFGGFEHYFAWLCASPYSTVAGTLTYDGQAHAAQGTGYHDHNWGNVALPAVMDHWTWGRAQVGDYTLIYVEQVALKKYGSTRMPVFLLAKGDRVLADDARCLTMQARDFVRHAGGRDYPREVDFVWKRGAERVQLALRAPQLIEAVSLLIGLPPLKREIAGLFVRPYYFRFNADLELSIDLGGIHAVERGPALYEIMMLR